MAWPKCSLEKRGLSPFFIPPYGTNMTTKPNVVLILNDDMGYSDIGCYGGEIRTPNLDRSRQRAALQQLLQHRRAAARRARRCSRACIRTRPASASSPTTRARGLRRQPEPALRDDPRGAEAHGYRTYMSGKWHVSSNLTKPTDSWPLQRGFDEFYGTIIGAGSFYDPNTLTRGNENVEHEAQAEGFFYTDAISDQAVEYIERHARERPSSRSSSTSPTPRRTGRCTRTTRTSRSTRGRFDKGWDRCARSGSTSWSNGASSIANGS
jgi:arylsulfatase